MKKVILFGATGNIGRAVAKELLRQSYDLTVVIRNPEKSSLFDSLTTKIKVADLSNVSSLKGICDGQEVVISTLGKSVSPNDRSKYSFMEVDDGVNALILAEAQKSGLRKFVYLSVFGADKYANLEYFKAHHQFELRLKSSSLDYAIIQPPAVFCSFIDLMQMAQKGQLVQIGSGEKESNPIFEGDLAQILVASILQNNSTIAAGGQKIYSRKKLNELIQQHMNKDRKFWQVPFWLLDLGLPFLRLLDKNSYDKFAFYTAVMKEDIIAPPLGQTSFEEYLKQVNLPA